jgi:two-component sensor histidine kinase
MMDSYPGALGQVMTNLINNAFIHAFDPDKRGRGDLCKTD